MLCEISFNTIFIIIVFHIPVIVTSVFCNIPCESMRPLGRDTLLNSFHFVVLRLRFREKGLICLCFIFFSTGNLATSRARVTAASRSLPPQLNSGRIKVCMLRGWFKLWIMKILSNSNRVKQFKFLESVVQLVKHFRRFCSLTHNQMLHHCRHIKNKFVTEYENENNDHL